MMIRAPSLHINYKLGYIKSQEKFWHLTVFYFSIHYYETIFGVIMMYGERLRVLREERGLKIYDISHLLGFDKDSYGKYEREYTTIPIGHLNTLCDYFQVSFDYIFGFSSDKQYSAEKAVDPNLAGQRLKEFRKEFRLTQTELGKVLGCSYGTIAGYERGRYLIATPFLYTICSKYHISADYLLGKIDQPKYINYS